MISRFLKFSLLFLLFASIGSGQTITQQPQNQTVLLGQSTIFNVLGTGITTYQWKKNGVAISGATAANYVTPGAVAGDNGASFTVVLNGSLTSSAATLSINTLNSGAGWTKIPGTVLVGTGGVSSENHTPCPPNGFRGWHGAAGDWTANCHNVFLDPGGGMMDWPRHRWCITNGGHNDYMGNEVYCLYLALAGKDINGNPFVASTSTYGPLVRMDSPNPPNNNALCQPENLPAATVWPIPTSLETCNGVANTVDVFGPGTQAWPEPTRPGPNSRHIWGGSVYLSTADGHGAYFVGGGSKQATGFSSSKTWMLDLTSIDLTCAPQLSPSSICDPLWTDSGSVLPNLGVDSLFSYNPNNKRVWYYTPGQGKLFEVDPTNFAAGYINVGTFPTGLFGNHSTGVMDTDHDRFIHVGSNVTDADGPNPMGYFDLAGWVPGGANPTHVFVTMDSTCTAMMAGMVANNQYGPAMFWHPIRKRLIIYPGYSNVIYSVDTSQSTWVCKSETYGTVEGVDFPQHSRFDIISAAPAEGTFTKFNYDPSLDVMVLCNDYAADCWYGRLAAWGGTLTNTSGATLTNQPISAARPFIDGDVAVCAAAFIDGVAVATTQTDVKNRWPDGTLKFGIVSFIIPSWPAGATIDITYRSQASCNNGTPQTKAQMLATGYNFDATIALTGTASPTISARAILSAATIDDPGADIEGDCGLANYWLQGPIVTAVKIEDRCARAFDVNTDGGTGNPLHPVFEAWFYPQNNAVQIGVSLEDIWASTIPTLSARDQTYNATVTIGCGTPCSGAAPVTVIPATGSIKQQTRTRWQRVFWLNQPDPLSLMTVDRSWRYLAETKFTPHWDPYLKVTATTLSSGTNPMQCTPAFFAGRSNGLVNVLTTGNFSVGCIPIAIGATGAAEYHGALPTWDIACFQSQDPNVCGVSFQSGLLGGHGYLINEVPYGFREADQPAGHGGFYNADGTGTTQGRPISIVARTQVSLNSVASPTTCNNNFSADAINFGTGGEDIAPWGALPNLDTTHSGNAAYAPYLMTGQYFFYETVMMQGAYAIGLGPSNQACVNLIGGVPDATHRNGASGYYYQSQERGQTWQARDNALAAFIAIDGSPEKKYFENFLKQNISVWQGARGLANDYPANTTSYNYGVTKRSTILRGTGTALGSWTQGQGFSDGSGSNYVLAGGPLNVTGPNTPQSGNAWFQNAYSAIVTSWIDDMGYTPSGNLRSFMANWYLNIILNPASNIFDLANYTYPTQDNSGLQTNISTWALNQTFYCFGAGCTAAGQVPFSNAWPTCDIGVDEGHQSTSLGAVAQFYNVVSSQGGYKGSDAWTTLNTSINCKPFVTGSTKWSEVPRITGVISGASAPSLPVAPASLTVIMH